MSAFRDWFLENMERFAEWDYDRIAEAAWNAATAQTVKNFTGTEQLKPKMPDYLEFLKDIDDSRLTTMPGKDDVCVGTRLMYDCIVRHFSL